MAVGADAKAALRSLIAQPRGFERKAGEIERVARQVLEQAGIVEPYRKEQPEWVTRQFGQVALPSWRAAAERAKYRSGSPEHHAAEALDCLQRARVFLKGGDTDMALEEAVTLGALGVGFGKKMLSRQTGKTNVAAVHGTDEHRAARWKKIAAAYDAEMRKNPAQNKGKAEADVAKRFKVGVRDVQRARAAQRK